MDQPPPDVAAEALHIDADGDLVAPLVGATKVTLVAGAVTCPATATGGVYRVAKATCAPLDDPSVTTATLVTEVGGKPIKLALDLARLRLDPDAEAEPPAPAWPPSDPLPTTGTLVVFDLDADDHPRNACVRPDGATTCDRATLPRLRPDEPLRVCVTALDHGYALRLTGEPGRRAPVIANPYRDAEAEAHSGATPTTVCHGPFAPRKPGSVAVELSTDDGATWRTAVELDVVATYAGAVRMGIGLSNVADHAYAVVTAPGSGQAEIALTSRGRWQPELVVGGTLFFDKGGRVYEDPRRFTEHLGLYLGLGIVDTGTEGDLALSALQSFYVGAEYEIGPTAAFALGPTLRQVTRLADGYRVGGPISGATVPTTEGYQLGFAAIVTLTPDVLRIIRPSWAQ